TEYMVRDARAKERVASAWLLETSNNATRTFALTMLSSPDDLRNMQQQIKYGSERISQLHKQLEANPTEEEKKLFATVATLRAAYREARDAVTRVQAEGDMAQVSQAVNIRLQPAIDAYVGSIRAVLTHEKEMIDASATS